LHETASFDVFCVKIGAGVWAVGERKDPQKERKAAESTWPIEGREITHV